MRSASRSAGLVAAAGTLLLVSPAPADDGGLRREIAALEARIAALERDSWLDERRTAEVGALIEAVLADADSRASLLHSGAQAGWDEGSSFPLPTGFSCSESGR